VASDRGDRAEAPNAGPQYQALYRRYRPQRFSEVLGQDHVTKALRNAVRKGQVAHAYLFSGPRGTGKTSTARILAMALNCEAPVDGEPDGTCTSCAAIRSGSSMDVFELDAASNRKLDEMRELLSRVALGTPGRWKVYIIDEVHQLTSDAASALLKTLEEPPGHVVFVLATTDPQKVLPTIQSRTQHFEFHLLDGELLERLLSGINRDAGLGLSPETVKLAVQRGRGSARDAESALEQLAVAGGEGGAEAPVLDLADALAARDASAVLQAVAAAVAAGKDPRRLGTDLVEHLRNAFLAQQAPSLVLAPPGTEAALSELAKKMGLAFLVRSMEAVGRALVDMHDSADPRVTLEVALVRLALPAADTSPAALLERIERLEKALERALLSGGTGDSKRAAATPPSEAGDAAVEGAAALGRGTGPAQARAALGAFLKPGAKHEGTGTPTAEPTQAQPTQAQPTQAQPTQAQPAAPQVRPAPGLPLPSRDQLTKAWGDSVLAQLPRPAQVYLASGRFTEVSEGAATYALQGSGMLSRALAFQAEAEKALAAHFGRPVPLRLVVDEGPSAPKEPPPRRPGAAAMTGGADDEGEEAVYDLDRLGELADAPPPVPVEQRILEAFPGAILDG
jgi:DNA polymerase-3 subunit gamma/tau